MINSLKKRKTQKTTLTPTTFKDNIRDIHVPAIYIRINQEIIRSKMMDYLSIRPNFLLYKKFFD